MQHLGRNTSTVGTSVATGPKIAADITEWKIAKIVLKLERKSHKWKIKDQTLPTLHKTKTCGSQIPKTFVSLRNEGFVFIKTNICHNPNKSQEYLISKFDPEYHKVHSQDHHQQIQFLFVTWFVTTYL